MTTENGNMVELPDRSVADLLNLDTYQGMTDSEIQSLIDWHVSNAVSSEENRVVREAQAQAAMKVVSIEQQAYEESSAMLNRLLSGSLLLRSV